MYLYLSKKEFVTNWINGGKVPLNPASYYRSIERKGKYTPDENIQVKITGEVIKPGIKATVDKVIHNAGTGTVNIIGNVINETGMVGENINYKQSYEDGVILSLSQKLSVDILNKLEKEAVVKIIDTAKLKSALDTQIGIISEEGLCLYTESDDRNHFLKHKNDSWQEEYRFFWPGIDKTIFVQLPKGIAIDVTLEILPS